MNILIVGVAGGMGQATARKFIENGNNVFGIDIKENFILENLTYFHCDIRKENDIIQVFENIKSQVDNLHAIICLSGIYKMDSLLEISDADFKNILDINALGMYRITKVFFPLLKQNSKILITSSEVAPLDPLPFNGIYTISKSFLEKYAFSLRHELNLFKIKVILLRPGAVSTTLINDSQKELNKMCEKTNVHKNTSKKFKKIVDSVESKSISPILVGKKIYKIINKKHNKYIYKINNNILLKLLNILPDRLQVKIISNLLKNK